MRRDMTVEDPGWIAVVLKNGWRMAAKLPSVVGHTVSYSTTVLACGDRGPPPSVAVGASGVLAGFRMQRYVSVVGLVAIWHSHGMPGQSSAHWLGICLGAAMCGVLVAARFPFLLADWKAVCRGTTWLASGQTLLFGLTGGYSGIEVAESSLGVQVRTGNSFAVPAA